MTTIIIHAFVFNCLWSIKVFNNVTEIFIDMKEFSTIQCIFTAVSLVFYCVHVIFCHRFHIQSHFDNLLWYNEAGLKFVSINNFVPGFFFTLNMFNTIKQSHTSTGNLPVTFQRIPQVSLSIKPYSFSIKFQCIFILENNRPACKM